MILHFYFFIYSNKVNLCKVALYFKTTYNFRMNSELKKILILGAGGYVGSLLTPYLLSMNYEVIAFDIFWFGSENLQPHPKLKIIIGDIVNYNFTEILKQVDAVIHLACISNDPSFDLNPNLSKIINYDSTINILKYINASEIKRFIFASSSSVYGVKKEDLVHEDLVNEPITLYAKYKDESEKYLIKNKKDHFDLVILRPATLCGPSPRLRLDLVTNLFVSHAFYKKRLSIHGGNQYRPQLNIKEMLHAYLLCLNHPKLFNSEIFNVGEINYTVDEIAELVKKLCPFQVIIEKQRISDERSYRISSEKFQTFFNYRPKQSLRDAIEDLYIFFQGNPEINIEDSIYHNVRKMKEINYHF